MKTSYIKQKCNWCLDAYTEANQRLAAKALLNKPVRPSLLPFKWPAIPVTLVGGFVVSRNLVKEAEAPAKEIERSLTGSLISFGKTMAFSAGTAACFVVLLSHNHS